ncbi:ergothioneine biosynthesis protein EgtB [Calothrix sp. UHCC 0171]|uniref:ergothioneine biosynthesis protein EgtB n=1 Tax=Calothrix sp. UHCC 0171 TaxID=3110245 RepID=UPI002B1F7375|nr:ergothioneine biosynthesis protein EgtB [Calothrix sp. UHCC 0171]MEA5571556.1 ergothioneine biosynthesis protein EgtB [Calothrix sp. UHCC 0171]
MAKSTILAAFQQCRQQTLALLEQIDAGSFCSQVHPDFSPVGWHFGHIAFTEALWLLERSAGGKCIFPQYRQLYAADGLPKSARVELPSIEETRDYLNVVREKVVDYLEVADMATDAKIWFFLLQHESQHCETISLVLELNKTQNYPSLSPSPSLSSATTSPALANDMIQIPAGEFEMGSNDIDALDNESFAHQVYLDTYYIDRYPVTCQQYREFMQAGGYENAQYWSDAGWRWLQSEQVQQPLKQPLYWHDNAAWDNHPVCGVSYYEAEAYAKFVGKRLPTEAEWEKAVRGEKEEITEGNGELAGKTTARQGYHQRKYPWGNEEPTAEYCNCAVSIFESQSQFQSQFQSQTTPVNAYPQGQSAYGMYDALGNVWEWTSSWFDAYPGFIYYPYIGYSQVYFDGKHRVLKGGSFATRIWAMRGSFRNWYHPHVRQIFAGFRCVSDER